MSDSTTVSGEIDTSRRRKDNAVRLPMKQVDASELVRPRSWPRATRELTFDLPQRRDDEQLRTRIWCAVGGLLIAVGLYLVF